MLNKEKEPDNGDIDFTPDDWDDSEVSPWDCDLSASWSMGGDE